MGRGDFWGAGELPAAGGGSGTGTIGKGAIGRGTMGTAAGAGRGGKFPEFGPGGSTGAGTFTPGRLWSTRIGWGLGRTSGAGPAWGLGMGSGAGCCCSWSSGG